MALLGEGDGCRCPIRNVTIGERRGWVARDDQLSRANTAQVDQGHGVVMAVRLDEVAGPKYQRANPGGSVRLFRLLADAALSRRWSVPRGFGPLTAEFVEVVDVAGQDHGGTARLRGCDHLTSDGGNQPRPVVVLRRVQTVDDNVRAPRRLRHVV